VSIVLISPWLTCNHRFLSDITYLQYELLHRFSVQIAGQTAVKIALKNCLFNAEWRQVKSLAARRADVERVEPTIVTIRLLIDVTFY